MITIEDLQGRFEPGKSSYEVPETMPAQVIWRGDESKKLCLESVPVPEIGPDEALVAIHSAGLNFNTLWTAMGLPVSSFDFLRRLKFSANTKADHNLEYHIPGSDGSGVVVKLGTEDTSWKIGDSVVLNCNWHRSDDPMVFQDSLLSTEQKIWGYETNFGSLAAFSVVKLHQLMPKPAHLNWHEAASYALVLCTAYRMLFTSRGADLRVGDSVLVWGAAGGLGLSALQLCALAGVEAVPVVSSPEKGEMIAKLGFDKFIDRKAEGLEFWKNESPNPPGWMKLKKLIKSRFGVVVDAVFEHPGRDTMGASVYVLKRGGRVVTCAATTGYDISYDNRFLWMESKSIIGCHFSNSQQASEANSLVCQGKIRPFVTSTYRFEEANAALAQFESNNGSGKVMVGVLSEPKSKLDVTPRNLF